MVSPAELLSTHVQMLHHHFQTYYQTLDLAASEDVSQLLFPNWHNSLQKPFLWFGDFHPNIFTNLLRSLLNTDSDYEEEEEEEGGVVTEKKSDYPLVWKYPSTNLMIGYDWIHSSGKSEILKCVSVDVMAQMEELVCVVFVN
ncbi:hypothetical protein MKW94_010071 [Papaver nudicaule]|uniref:DOG1 domain-containing protein n=1 Tax=Papaver nudicaule TaxID=74823 RepID=A0AA41VSF2_PAPNU|nr:hypothetical protein [Papaver nudicaule]